MVGPRDPSYDSARSHPVSSFAGRLSGDPPFMGSSEDKLFEHIKRGDLNFSASVWQSVSEAGKCRALVYIHCKDGSSVRRREKAFNSPGLDRAPEAADKEPFSSRHTGAEQAIVRLTWKCT